MTPTQGRIKMARHGWVTLLMAALFLAGAVKIATVDRELLIALYPLAAAGAFGLVTLLSWLWSGTIEVTGDDVRWRLRNGRSYAVPLADVETVGIYGTRRAGNQHIGLRCRDGKIIRLRRAVPLDLVHAIRARLKPTQAAAVPAR